MAAADQMLAAAAQRAEELAVGDMDSRPRRKVAVVSCMDARIDVYRLLGIEPGDAHVIRNAGGLVTDDAIRSLSASQRLLGTEEVVVIMHERCGLLGASEDEWEQALARDGALPSFRLGAFDDLEGALREGLLRLRAHPALIARDAIRGFIFDPVSGSLREVT